MGYIGNVVQSVELVPFEGEAIKESEIVRETVTAEVEVEQRELIEA